MEIIAEVGINHNGNFDLLEELIRQAALNGADLIKFQLYSSQVVFGDDSRKKNEFTFDQVKEIKQICEYYDKEFLASVFDEEKIEWCESLDVKRYKIASRTWRRQDEDEVSKKVVDGVLKTGKETFAALGGCEALSRFIRKCDNVKFFNCMSEYPVKWNSLKDSSFFEFNGKLVGWSDHCHGIGACLYAISKGAQYVEKHFTLSKSDMTHHDHIGSMTPEELSILNVYGRELSRVCNSVNK